MGDSTCYAYFCKFILYCACVIPIIKLHAVVVKTDGRFYVLCFISASLFSIALVSYP